MKELRQYRQGDVLVREVAEIPAAAATPVARDEGRVVLAYGELTGHAHAFGRESRITMFRDDGAGRSFIHVAEPAPLQHEEHGAIAVPASNYEVVRQREYTPEAVRTVAD